MRVIIAGGGIGGLATAVALRQHGIEAKVFEQAEAFGDIGAGVWITANGVRVLRHLGAAGEFEANAVLCERQISSRIEDNSPITQVVHGDRALDYYGVPSYFTHRSDLLSALLNRLDPGAVYLGSKVARFQEEPDCVSLQLEDGRTVWGDVLIGADGVRSAIRAQRFGSPEPLFSGMVVWRAVFPTSRITAFEPGNTGWVWNGGGRDIVSYAVRRGELYNFVGYVPRGAVSRESWTLSGDIADLRRTFSGCCDEVQNIVDSIDEAFITGLYYRDPFYGWSTARTALLGDAAHPFVPTSGQGAQMALEDAVTIADCLARYGKTGISVALDEYVQRRHLRATRVQAYGLGNLRSMQVVDAQTHDARINRRVGVTRLDPLGLHSVGWVFKHDPIAALHRPPGAMQGVEEREPPKPPSRCEATRAFELWAGAITPVDRGGGWRGERSGYERFMVQNFLLPGSTRLEAVSCDGVPSFWIGGAPAKGEPILFHLHGGWLSYGSAKASAAFAKRLADAAGLRALVVDYRLAPEHGYPAPLDDTVTAWRWLQRLVGADAEIVISAEDAGAVLALSLMRRLRDAGGPLPRFAYFVSPMVDMTLQGESIDANAGKDPLHNRVTLTWLAGSYFQRCDPADPDISPLFADLRGLPPVLIEASREEALFDDARRLAEKARASGLVVQFEPESDTVPSFPLFDFLPETRRALVRFRAMISQEPNVVAPARGPSVPCRTASID